MLFALFHRNRIDDGLARNAFQPRLDHAPFAAVDHQWHARDIGFGGDAFEERGHRQLSVEQAFVHIDVNNLGTILDLVTRDLDGGFIVVGEDQFLELGDPVTLVRSPILTNEEPVGRLVLGCWVIFYSSLSFPRKRESMA